MLVTHEVVGHSLVTLLLGGHVVRITTVDSSYSGIVSPLAARSIAAAGIAANLLAGVLALAIAPTLKRLRYFVWFYGHANLFMGASYLAGFAFLPFGDVHAVLAGLPFQFVWQILAVTAGVAMYAWAFADARRTAPGFALVPYLGMGAAATLGSLANPAGLLQGALWAAAATFGAGYAFVAATKDAPPAKLDRDGRWIAAGIAAVFVLLRVLGPGITF
jgi:hypothetical protein